MGLGFATPVQAVSIDWVAVGDPGNSTDTTGYGAVSYSYWMGQYEVTNAQYVEFLNAVAAADPNGLYSGSMTASVNGGILRSGSSGSYTYSAKSSMADRPVNFVTFYDAARFANWLHNGQPVGAQGPTTTEDGAYTITLAGVLSNSITRNASAEVFLPSRDEWYKAAYYDSAGVYFDYPAGSNTATVCATVTATPNRGNCNLSVGGLTDVGAYTGSASPYGTFDQGGNVFEWTEAINGGNRMVRGGSFNFASFWLAFSSEGSGGASTEYEHVGFRVATVPEPAAALLVGLALAAIGARWRSRAAGGRLTIPR